MSGRRGGGDYRNDRNGGSRGGGRNGGGSGGGRVGAGGGRGRGNSSGGGPAGRSASGGSGGGPGRGGPRGPDLSRIKSVLTNILPAKLVENFSFYIYSFDSTDKNDHQIESRWKRTDLFMEGVFDKLLKEMPSTEKEDLKRVVFFAGSFCFSGRKIPGLEKEKLPLEIMNGSTSDGDTMRCVDVKHFGPPAELKVAPPPHSKQEIAIDTCRCSGCSRSFASLNHLLQHCKDSGHTPVFPPAVDGPAMSEVFIAFANMALQRALGERLKRWGQAFIDPLNPIPGNDRNGRSLGIDIYESYACSFGLIRDLSDETKAQLTLTVDLRAKILRTTSVLEALNNGRSPGQAFSKQEQDRAIRTWTGEQVIYTKERKGYTIVSLDFEHSPRSLPVPDKGISHEEYFKQKGVTLKYPDAKPMVVVLGRHDRRIHLPAELVTGNELEPRVREMLPQIASFTPEKRNQAIVNIKKFLVPGAQKTKGAGGMLPSLGIILQDQRLPASCKVLPVPTLIAQGVQIPKEKAENWAPVLSKANFNVKANSALVWNVVLVHHDTLKSSALKVYQDIANLVNSMNAKYRFGAKPLALINAGDRERSHWGEVEKYFSGKVKENVFVLDFVRPNGALDNAYPVVKQILTKHGFLSQFVNFKTYSHDNPREERRSHIILEGVARQILQKSGVNLWWVSLPKEVPLPVIFIGVDVFHAPPVFNKGTGRRERKRSVAGVIVQLIEKNTPSPDIKLYTESFVRDGGDEYDLREALKSTVGNALKAFKVNPASVVCWRDGIAETAFDKYAEQEILGIREGCNVNSIVGAGKKTNNPILTYIVCQKRISTKFLTRNVPGHEDGKFGAPAGTLVSTLQSMNNQTFYINGRAPPFSTPKPVRFICVQRDDGHKNVPIAELTWGQCHNYPNWAGPIKVPSVCQMAHKLSELTGQMADAGASVNNAKFKNQPHFL